jgi:conjugal transfer ATP-binding protein TraC
MIKRKKAEKQPKRLSKKVPKDIVFDLTQNETTNKRTLEKGMSSVKDFIAPPSFERGFSDYMKVGDKYVRNFVIKGYPNQVSVGWLDYLYNYDGDLDVVINIEPSDERAALEELTQKITQFEAQLINEEERGSIRNVTKLRNDIRRLYEQREKLENNYENLFYVQIACNLYADSLEELNKEWQKIDNKLKGRKIYPMPTYLRQDDGYKTVLPFGKTYLPDLYRNFNTGSLTACFPFYNSEISHEKGVMVGVNLTTSTPLLIDFFDRTKLNNGNITIFGQAGSGKTFLLSLITMRSSLRGVRTAMIDAEGEFAPLTRALGGSLIQVYPGSNQFINPFDVEEEFDDKLGKEVVNLKEKISDCINLIAVMNGGLDNVQRAVVSDALSKMYEDFGINEDPNSLYEEVNDFDERTQTMVHGRQKKRMPTFSNFHDILTKMVENETDQRLTSLVKALAVFKKGGIYDLFDQETSEDLRNFKNAPIVTFDVSRLEENVLRPIGMYVALSWTWEKFGKKNPDIKKRIVCDEAWMLLNRNMAGYEFTAQFLENVSRRSRKRNCSLLVSSQNFLEFAESSNGKAVLTNAFVNIFLRQSSTDIDAVQQEFHLSDGERNFLMQAQRGEFLIRMNGDSYVAYALAFDYEIEFISKANHQITGNEDKYFGRKGA